MAEPSTRLGESPISTPTPPRRRWRAASLTMLTGGLVILVVLAALLPVPYVALGPGPTEDTLGKQPDGTPLIDISGRRTYPTTGRLELVTVSVTGGPGGRLDLVTALRGWVDHQVAVVPEETVYPPDVTAEEVRNENVVEMSTSQQDATVAALTHLGIPVTGPLVAVRAVVRGSPADGLLRPGDRIMAVDGQRVSDPQQVRKAIEAHHPGERVRVSIQRQGAHGQAATRTIEVPTTSEGGRTVVGFYPGVAYDFPFTITIDPGAIGGPSAGLMFALGIIDKLTPGSLTGGAVIAGTGTIDTKGRVGAIGGIQEKLVGAVDSGARYFLAPAGNCDAVAGAVPDGLRVVKVSTLDDALAALSVIRAISDGSGTPTDLPSCGPGA